MQRFHQSDATLQEQAHDAVHLRQDQSGEQLSGQREPRLPIAQPFPPAGGLAEQHHHNGRSDPGVTGVVITHDMDSAYRISDRIAMLYEGRIRAVGTVEEIRGSEDPLVRAFIEGRPELMEGMS